jgi:hypothetical protein
VVGASVQQLLLPMCCARPGQLCVMCCGARQACRRRVCAAAWGQLRAPPTRAGLAAHAGQGRARLCRRGPAQRRRGTALGGSSSARQGRDGGAARGAAADPAAGGGAALTAGAHGQLRAAAGVCERGAAAAWREPGAHVTRCAAHTPTRQRARGLACEGACLRMQLQLFLDWVLFGEGVVRWQQQAPSTTSSCSCSCS